MGAASTCREPKKRGLGDGNSCWRSMPPLVSHNHVRDKISQNSTPQQLSKPGLCRACLVFLLGARSSDSTVRKHLCGSGCRRSCPVQGNGWKRRLYSPRLGMGVKLDPVRHRAVPIFRCEPQTKQEPLLWAGGGCGAT